MSLKVSSPLICIIFAAFSSALSEESAEGRPLPTFVAEVHDGRGLLEQRLKMTRDRIRTASMAVRLNQSVGIKLVLRVVEGISWLVVAIGVCNDGIHGKCGAIIGNHGLLIAAC